MLAATELVAEKGAADVSLDDVCERAPASRSQLYHYFEDREDLIRAVVLATSDAVLGAQDELLAHLDSWRGIERWMDALVDLQVQRGACGGCPLGTLAGQLAEQDQQARESIAAGLSLWQERIAAGLSGLQASGGLRPDADPGQLAKATIALLQGGLLLTQVNRDPNELRQALDAALRLLRSEQ